MSKNIQMSDAGVPIVVTYRKILRKRKLKRERRFVGAVQLVKNLLHKTIEMIEEAAFETKVEEIEPGQSVAVHWAISVEDPWDTTTGVEKNLIAYRMLNDIPPSGIHFEVVSPLKEADPPQSDSPKNEPARSAPVDITPEQFRAAQSRHEESPFLAGTRGPNGEFRRPPASEYQPRRVRTLEEELVSGELDDEDAEDLDWSHLQREDD